MACWASGHWIELRSGLADGPGGPLAKLDQGDFRTQRKSPMARSRSTEALHKRRSITDANPALRRGTWLFQRNTPLEWMYRR